MRKTALVLFTSLALGSVFLYTAYLQAPRIVVEMLGKTYGLDIKYRHAVLTPRLVNKEILIDFNLEDVRIRKNITQAPEERSYNSLSDLIAAPFNNAGIYERVSGTFKPSREEIDIIALTAEARDLKFSAKGKVSHKDKSADLDILISFSGELVSKISKELSGAVLKDEPGGWKSLSVKIKGDFRSPSISITGSKFRLNIRELPE